MTPVLSNSSNVRKTSVSTSQNVVDNKQYVLPDELWMFEKDFKR